MNRQLPAVALLIIAAACGGNTPTAPERVPTLSVTRIMAFGDSLTEGESLGQLRSATGWSVLGLHDHGTPGVESSYPAQLSIRLRARYPAQDVRVFNAGLGGEMAEAGRARLVTEIGQYQPQALLLMHGANNVNHHRPTNQVASYIEQMVRSAQDRGVVVFLATLPRQIKTPKAPYPELVPQYNAAFRAVASNSGARLVDIYAVVTDEMLMPDGLHITPAGNIAIAEAFRAAIVDAFER